MHLKRNKIKLKPIHWRCIYMVIAIVASMMLSIRPAFSFQDDKGIIYVREFSMDMKVFVETRTNMQTGIQHIESTMSVKGIYLCYIVMVLGSILCFFCFFSNYWRVWLCNITAFAAGIYYILIIYYAIQITDIHYTTLYPNITILFPAIVLQTMVLVRKNIIRDSIEQDEEGEELL